MSRDENKKREDALHKKKEIDRAIDQSTAVARAHRKSGVLYATDSPLKEIMAAVNEADPRAIYSKGKSNRMFGEPQERGGQLPMERGDQPEEPLGLTEAILSVKRELEAAVRSREGSIDLTLDKVELELIGHYRMASESKGGVRFYVLNLGSSVQSEDTQTHRVKIVLRPHPESDVRYGNGTEEGG